MVHMNYLLCQTRYDYCLLLHCILCFWFSFIVEHHWTNKLHLDLMLWNRHLVHLLKLFKAFATSLAPFPFISAHRNLYNMKPKLSFSLIHVKVFTSTIDFLLADIFIYAEWSYKFGLSDFGR